jgi:hypothetical protein
LFHTLHKNNMSLLTKQHIENQWAIFLNMFPFPASPTALIKPTWIIEEGEEDTFHIYCGGVLRGDHDNRYIDWGTTRGKIEIWLNEAVSSLKEINPSEVYEITYTIDEDSYCTTLMITYESQLPELID